jgi:hypothetical protein
MKKNKKYLDKVVKNIDAPYIENMVVHYGVKTLPQQKYVLSQLFNVDSKDIIKEFEYFGIGPNIVYHEYCGHWSRREFDSNHRKCTYFVSSDNFWVKNEFDENGKLVYSINSKGQIIDKR